MKILAVMHDKTDLDSLESACCICWPDLEIISTGSLRKTMEVLRTTSPDIVILDMYLDGLDGFHVLQQIRTCSDVPVLALSYLHDTSQIVRALELGADAYLVKPFNQMELVAYIRAIMRRICLSGLKAAPSDGQPAHFLTD
jgi:DNA-binding response OmpR family regulator